MTVSGLEDEEVETLVEQAPQLRALLAPEHPAASISRNLYRLARLMKVPSSATIRTEAALADSWWMSGDLAPSECRRSAQRPIANLASEAIAGRDFIEMREDSPARQRHVRSQSLGEIRRDRLGFYHGHPGSSCGTGGVSATDGSGRIDSGLRLWCLLPVVRDRSPSRRHRPSILSRPPARFAA